MFSPDLAQLSVLRRPRAPRLSLLLLAVTLMGLFAACSNTRSGVQAKADTAPAAVSELPDTTAMVSAEPVATDSSDDDGDLDEAIARATAEVPEWAPRRHRFNPSRERRWDLLHTRLDARLDFTRHELSGTAQLDLTPLFYAQDSLVLDAKGMLIDRVELVLPTGRRALSFAYPDSMRLAIALPSTYTAEQRLTVAIAYTARPDRRPKGGSAAIAQDKGLYFIDPNPLTGKPRQVWTQGETEATSVWLPTIDAPNERATQQISLTVPDSMVTLSNGTRTAQRRNADGTRTDTWRLDQPHAPYLIMIAAGRYAVVTDRWRGKEVSYYVEPAYVAQARGIFGRTPEMLEFYSKKLGVAYPWPHYRQIVVRDFVSGAMENTGAVTFYEQVQQDARGLLDVNSDDVIAHELFHHWFGDLVTCESWANLPLNESFATYGEYLWFEHKNGKLDADRRFDADLRRYLEEANEKREPLIRYYYADKEDMFDRHSYQKGGRVLHYLRYQLGDAAFFAGLKHYLTTHAYQAVEIHDLRQAFEAVTGRDLQQFFEQWFLAAGHPELETDHNYYPESQRLQISIQQRQNLAYQPLFTLPMQIEVGLEVNGRIERRRYPVTVSTADTTLSLPLERAPLYVDVDADKVIPGRLSEDKSFAEWIAQLKHAQGYKQRADAIEALSDTSHPEALAAIVAMLDDPFWGLRLDAVEALDDVHLPANLNALLPQLIRLSRDRYPAVRTAAVERLAAIAREVGRPQTSPQEQALIGDPERAALVQALTQASTDSSYAVTAAAIFGLYPLNSGAALTAVKANLGVRAPAVRAVVAEVLMSERTSDAYERVVSTLEAIDSQAEAYGLIQSFGYYLTSLDDPQQAQGIAWLKARTQPARVWFVRVAAVSALKQFRDRPEIAQLLSEIVRSETDPRLKRMFASE